MVIVITNIAFALNISSGHQFFSALIDHGLYSIGCYFHMKLQTQYPVIVYKGLVRAGICL